MENKDKTGAGPAPEQTKKLARLELTKAGRLSIQNPHRVIAKGDVVGENDVSPETFKRLKGSGLFKVLGILAAFAVMSLASSAVAAPTGTNFSYQSTIGVGGSYLPTLGPVFGTIDTAFTGVKGGMHSPVATIAALKAVPATGATARADNQTCLVDAGPTSGAALYQFDSASSTAGDDNLVVVPTSGTGRWKKIADYGDTAKSSSLISIANGMGASLVGLEDASPGKFTATTVEAALREKAVELDTLEAKTLSYLAPVIAEWDPTGPIAPPTSTTGDRYLANASAGAYTVWRVYEYNGTAWVEHTPVNGDTLYNKGTDRLLAFNGAMWDYYPDAADLALTTTPGGASYIGVFDTAGKITATNVETALAEIAADGWVTSTRIANGTIVKADVGLDSCTAGQYWGVDSGATAWECKTPLANAPVVKSDCTSTGGASTCAGDEILVTTQAYTTASGANETLVITNSSLVAGKFPIVTGWKGTCTKFVMVFTTSYDTSAHTITVTVENMEETDALDGTMKIAVKLLGTATP